MTVHNDKTAVFESRGKKIVGVLGTLIVSVEVNYWIQNDDNEIDVTNAKLFLLVRDVNVLIFLDFSFRYDSVHKKY